ncbi:hypothetical protein DMR_09630 [Solidesulfovibrio magneticus RS-1]|uniref:Uncharacterized protein n=1 Tax=Solidesulfovibrio magneticus (strain ATCC 700980 / DSM 13731 / RS-1) TaxID=573370 RepID=C4XKR5_SOLM1|nr:hypothetical protein DMR_09630 [Solidesulfovibrio magneticus RS-1]
MKDYFDPLRHLREQCNCQVYLDNSQNICLRFGPRCGLESIMSAQSIVKKYDTQLQLRLKNQCIISHANFSSSNPSKHHAAHLDNKTRNNFAA